MEPRRMDLAGKGPSVLSVARLKGFYPLSGPPWNQCWPGPYCLEAMALPCRGFGMSEAAGGSGAPLTLLHVLQEPY